MKSKQENVTVANVIRLWPSVGEFAADLGVSAFAAYKMRDRNAIRAKHWPTLLSSAQRRGLAVDAHTLIALVQKAA